MISFNFVPFSLISFKFVPKFAQRKFFDYEKIKIPQKIWLKSSANNSSKILHQKLHLYLDTHVSNFRLPKKSKNNVAVGDFASILNSQSSIISQSPYEIIMNAHERLVNVCERLQSASCVCVCGWAPYECVWAPCAYVSA